VTARYGSETRTSGVFWFDFGGFLDESFVEDFAPAEGVRCWKHYIFLIIAFKTSRTTSLSILFTLSAMVAGCSTPTTSFKNF
jgi:hypothetical protein